MTDDLYHCNHFTVSNCGAILCISCTYYGEKDGYRPVGSGVLDKGCITECNCCGEDIGWPEDGGTAHLSNHLRKAITQPKES